MNNGLSKKLITLETWVAAGSLFLLLALSIFQIFLRNILDFGYPEIDLINRHLLVVCGMMGAVLATSSFKHIKIDALTTIIPKGTQHTIQPALQIFACIVCTALCYYAYLFCIDEYQYAPTNERWLLPFSLTYPIGFSLMSLHFFLNAFSINNVKDN